MFHTIKQQLTVLINNFMQPKNKFLNYEKICRFTGCNHINEPDCGVKNAMEEGKISPVRYEHYVQMYGELKEQRRY